jgi:hypothetical protein
VTVYQGVVPDGMVAEVKREFDVAYGARYDEQRGWQTTPSAFDKAVFDEDKLLHHKISKSFTQHWLHHILIPDRVGLYELWSKVRHSWWSRRA